MSLVWFAMCLNDINKHIYNYKCGNCGMEYIKNKRCSNCDNMIHFHNMNCFSHLFRKIFKCNKCNIKSVQLTKLRQSCDNRTMRWSPTGDNHFAKAWLCNRESWRLPPSANPEISEVEPKKIKLS